MIPSTDIRMRICSFDDNSSETNTFSIFIYKKCLYTSGRWFSFQKNLISFWVRYISVTQTPESTVNHLLFFKYKKELVRGAGRTNYYLLNIMLLICNGSTIFLNIFLVLKNWFLYQMQYHSLSDMILGFQKNNGYKCLWHFYFISNCFS